MQLSRIISACTAVSLVPLPLCSQPLCGQVTVFNVAIATSMNGNEIVPMVLAGTIKRATAAIIGRQITKGAQFSVTGGIGSSALKYDAGGELTGDSFSVSGTTGVVAAQKIALPRSVMPSHGGFVVYPTMTTAQMNAVLAAAAGVPGVTVDFYPNARGYIPVSSQGVRLGTCYNQAFALLLKDSTDVTLDFHGATLLNMASDTPTYAHTLCLDGNRRVKIRHGNIDWNNLPFTQGAVTAVQTRTRPYSFTFKPMTGYTPAFTSLQRVYQFNPNGDDFGGWVNSIWDQGGAASLPLTNNGDGTYTVQETSTHHFDNVPTTGISVAINSKIYHADGVRLFQNKGATFDNFVVYAAAGIGIEAYGWITGQASQSDITVMNGSGTRIKGGTNRVQSVNADCMHLQAVRGEVNVLNSVMEGCQDDGINVYDFDSKVTRVTNAAAFVIDNGRPWLPADTLRFVDAAGVIQGTAIMSSITLVSGGPSASVVLSASAPLGLAVGWIVENDTESPTFYFSRNRVGRSKGHGVFTAAKKSKIVGNYFHDINADAAIRITQQQGGWNEGVYPSGIDIEDNQFDRVNVPSPGFTTGGLDAGAITIQVTGTDGATETITAQLPDVVIRNNSFTHTGASGIYASGIKSGDITGNYFADWGLFPTNPYPNAAAFHNNTKCAISIWAAGSSAGPLNIGVQKYGTLTKSTHLQQ